VKLCLWMFCLLAPVLAARAEDIRLIYFFMPPYASEVDGKAVGPVVDLLKTLTQGLPVADQPMKMPLKRIEYALQSEKTIAVALGRTPRRETLGLTWVAELFRDDYYFVTLTSHRPVDSFEQARAVKRVACNLGAAPADVLRDHGVVNLESAYDLRSEAAKLRAGHADVWFDLKSFIEPTWRSLGYDPAELHWSPPVATQRMWIVASPKVEPAVIETIRQRYAALKEQGKLDPLFAAPTQ